MRKIKVTATFVGKDGSMGFVNGQEYNLILKSYEDGSISVDDCNKDTIFGNSFCDYESFIAFLKNWTNVKYTSWK